MQIHSDQSTKTFKALVRKEGEQKRRYLCGVFTGIGVDGHNQRLSEAAITDIIRQCGEKDILLFINHEKDYTDDIGKLTNYKLLDNNDIYGEFRLHELSDGISQEIADKIETVWKQATGQPPYEHPKKFGFSIEGHENPAQRVKDHYSGVTTLGIITIDPGVTLVTVPAYAPSEAKPVMKQKSIISKISKSIMDTISGKKIAIRQFKEAQWELEDTFHEVINGIIEHPDLSPEQKETALIPEFESYKNKFLENLRSNGFINPSTSEQVFDEIETKIEGEPSITTQESTITQGVKMSQVKKEAEDALSIANIISQLQMLQQKESAENDMMSKERDVEPGHQLGEEPKREDNILKQFTDALAKAGYVKKEEGKASDEEVMKSIVKVLKESGEGSEFDFAELEDAVQPVGAIDGDYGKQIKKMLVPALEKIKKERAAKAEKDGVMTAINELVKINKSLVDKTNVLEEALTHVTKGMGFQPEIIQPVQPEMQPVRKGLNSNLDEQITLKDVLETMMDIRKETKPVMKSREHISGDMVSYLMQPGNLNQLPVRKEA